MMRLPILRKNGCAMIGAAEALRHNPGVVIIHHRPGACEGEKCRHDLRMFYQIMANRQYVPGKYAAQIGNAADKQCVFWGDIAELSQQLKTVARREQTKYVAIIDSCISDFSARQEQFKELQKDVKVPVIFIPWKETKGYYDGFYQATLALLDEFVHEPFLRQRSAVLIGEKKDLWATGGLDIVHMLQNMGVRIQCLLPGPASVADIQRLGDAAFSIPISTKPEAHKCMRKVAIELERRWGIPWVQLDYPAGWNAVRKWTECIGKLAGREKMARQIVQEQQVLLFQCLDVLRRTLRRKNMTLCINHRFQDITWFLELMTQAGIWANDQDNLLNKKFANITVTAGCLGTGVEVVDCSLPDYIPAGSGGLIETINCLLLQMGRTGGDLQHWQPVHKEEH